MLETGTEINKFCPEHPQDKLIVKRNRRTGFMFLGCPRWPECEHTETIPEEFKMRDAGQMELFDEH